MSNVYSFLDVQAAIVGPGGAFSLGSGAGAADEGISIDPAGEIDGMQIGADGVGQHSLHADKSGKVTVRVLKTSPVNKLLMALYNFQTASAASHGQNTITISDAVRGDTVTCRQCAFAKAPNLNYGKEAGTQDWEFNAIAIDRVLGS
jgi:hypothetical protein